jgi:hypothetical protein
MFNDPHLAQAFKQIFSGPQVKCPACGSSGDPQFHSADACAVVQHVKAATNPGYVRAASVLRGERATDWSAA